jgi:hypothetical protein
LVELGVLIGCQKGGVDAVGLCRIHGILKIRGESESTWWTKEG